MYYANNKKFGFWIVRDSWGGTLAKVINIDGVIEGESIKGGRYPYFSNQIVTAEFYNQNKIDDCNSETLENVSEVLCAGTYAYDMLQNPLDALSDIDFNEFKSSDVKIRTNKEIRTALKSSRLNYLELKKRTHLETKINRNAHNVCCNCNEKIEVGKPYKMTRYSFSLGKSIFLDYHIKCQEHKA